MDFINQIITSLDNYLNLESETTEHALIQKLAMDQIEPFSQFDLKQSKGLFNAHFLLHHALYHLQNRYLDEQCFILQIEMTRIKRLPYQAANAALCHHDAVKAYYLDFQNFLDTTEDDVNELLTSFWEGFTAHESKHQDLSTLGLPPDASYAEVKQQFRQLAQEAHPDKGGNADEFIKLSQAKANLDKLFQ